MLSRFAPVAQSSSLRLALVISAIFASAMLLAGAVSYVLLTNQLQARLRDDARQMTENLAATYQVAGLPELHAQIATNVATTRDYAILYLFVDASGRIVFGNFRLDQPFTGPRDLVAGRNIALPGRPGDDAERFSAYGLRIPAGWIITARNTNWIADTQGALIQSIALGLAFALLLSVSLAIFLARRSERRIAQLNTVLDRVAGGDLTVRADGLPVGRDDIARIARSINATLDRLSLTVESLRQVSNDIAHDLRTPLTRLRTRLEPLLMRDDLPDGAASEIESAVTETEEIVRAFNAVLRIAQIEGGNARPRSEPVDLAELAQAVHDMLEPVAEEQGHRFTCDTGAGPVSVIGDREMLAHAATNLVENAFRHCPAPADIRLSVGQGAGKARLSVCDNGPGIPADERDRVFRRFYRLEKSRSTEGSGLGLSLVAAIAHLHRGEVRLRDNAPGLCAEI
ncbi:MAG: HAMP domain-containing sensor histidine kinase, partial [Paracoccaceae bacterium]